MHITLRLILLMLILATGSVHATRQKSSSSFKFLRLKSSTGERAPLIIEPGLLTPSSEDGAIEFDGSDLYITKSGVKTVLGSSGAKGDKGDKGDPGERGPRGLTGPAGPSGPAGVTGTATPAGSTGQIQFNSSGVLAANGNFSWDNTNARLGIGTNSPNYPLQIGSGTAVTNTSNLAIYPNTTINSGFSTRMTLAGANNYQDIVFEKTDAVSTMKIWTFGNRYDTYFGNASGSFQIVGLHTDGLLRTPLIAQPNGDLILVGASNAISGNLGVGTTAPLAKLQIGTGATTTKGLIVKAIAAQTANLTEWQNSAGTVKSLVDNGGRMAIAKATRTTGATLDVNGSVYATGLKIPTGASSGYVLTSDGSGVATWQAVSAGISGSTGATDNVILRSDGTGAATLQNSALVIDDLYTASPNNTVNVASIGVTGGTTNVGVAIVPKGTGSFSLAVPDGTSTGGNARGANAVDLQTSRSAATQVASGSNSIAIGALSTASGTSDIAIGYANSASGSNSIALGRNSTAQIGSIAIGSENTTATGTSSIAIGVATSATAWGSTAIGRSALANRQNQLAFTTTSFGSQGDAQLSFFILRTTTTNSTPATLFAQNAGGSARLTIPSGKLLYADILISGIKSDGTAAACYKRKVAIRNVGGTTTLVGSVETIGTDIEDNASTDVTITADNTNDALQIDVTGITAETWRWVAVVEGVEVAYGL